MYEKMYAINNNFKRHNTYLEEDDVNNKYWIVIYLIDINTLINRIDIVLKYISGFVLVSFFTIAI